ncbi:hypothetical protein QJS10_CPA06g02498 [Acorus calamus]|uniref:Pentatricopeptide repeat-containing protein n=1 Tax=Acorus calamus TaxID=4465 RepID=A0AAV9EJ30_ACOCL|nr:hypothetical protein QJS10_CPA06g02498 [Acorus calamus]
MLLRQPKTTGPSFFTRLLSSPSHHHLRRPVSPSDAVDPTPTRTDAWIAKVVSTVFVRSPSLDASESGLLFFRDVLTPPIAREVVRRLKDSNLALKFFAFTQTSLGFEHPVSTYRLLIGALPVKEARMVFDRMIECGLPPDLWSFERLVLSVVETGDFESAVDLLSRASDYQFRVSAFVYNKILHLLIKKGRVSEAIRFFTECSGTHFTPDACSFNTVIAGLCRTGELDRAFELFNAMGQFGCAPDMFTYNTLVYGLCLADQVDRAWEVLMGLVRSGGLCSPDVRTFTRVMSGYCKLGRMKEASVVFSEMIGLGIQPSSVTYNVLIDGYGKAGDVQSAVSFYERMKLCGCSPDVVTYTSLIDGYCRNGFVDESMKLWIEMKERRISPNVYTFAVLINALCKENWLREARELLVELKWRRDILPRPFIYNPVVDGFCKAGDVDEANMIVAEMEEKGCSPDKFTYTILIIGHCMKGRMLEAINLFHKMVNSGCAPDSITASSLVSCLLKAGMPNEAHQIKIAASGKDSSFDSQLSRSSLLRNDMSIPVAV